MQIKVAAYTLGCKLNQYESEALTSSFESQGFFIVSSSEKADIYIINTCTVTSKAEQKARRIIRKFSSENTTSIIIVTGCYAQLDKEDLKLGHNVVVVSNDDKFKIKKFAEYLKKNFFLDINIEQAISFFNKSKDYETNHFWLDSVNYSYHTRAFLKIQDGCDNSCAYCRVTIARGDSVSLNIESVIDQYLLLHKKGFKEVVLTGINLASYYSNGIDFCHLLKELVDISTKNKSAPRIRLSSIEPESINSELVNVLSNKIICPHFHIPVQSGSDKILSSMNRHNNSIDIKTAVDLLRKARPGAFFAADIITGFPGETDNDFLQTKNLVLNCNFSYLHVFPFSPRPETLAEKMIPKVPERISRERTKILRNISRENLENYLNSWVGKELDLLIEEKKGDYFTGTSENYIKCNVYDLEANIGEIYKVHVHNIDNNKLICKKL